MRLRQPLPSASGAAFPSLGPLAPRADTSRLRGRGGAGRGGVGLGGTPTPLIATLVTSAVREACGGGATVPLSGSGQSYGIRFAYNAMLPASSTRAALRLLHAELLLPL